MLTPDSEETPMKCHREPTGIWPGAVVSREGVKDRSCSNQRCNGKKRIPGNISNFWENK